MEQYILRLLACLLMAGSQLLAQQRVAELAQPGPNAIFVYLGVDLPSSNLPKRNGVAYRIERRMGSSGGWTTVADVSAPGTSEEFSKRLVKTLGYMPKPASPAVPVQQLWEKIRKYGRLDSLGFWAGVLSVRLAAGSAFADTTASPNVKYEYSVSLVDAAGKAVMAMRSSSVSFPGSPRFAPLRVVEKNVSVSRITVRWVLQGIPKPSAYSVYRMDGFGGSFDIHSASTTILSNRDGTFVVVEDTSVQQNRIYQYYLLPLDYYGNQGQPSDTAMVSSSDVRSHPLPQHLRASSDDSLGGIKLSWSLADPSSISSIRVFRSEAFDSGFVELAEIPGSDSTFVDVAVEPMKKYVYYLVLVGPLGEKSPASAKTFGIFETSQAPVPPQGLQAERVRNGVRVRWPRNDVFLKGYYVYRSDGISDSLRLLSPLVPARDSITTYTDSSALSSGKFRYLYAIRSENTSHVLSPFSDTVFASSGGGYVPSPSGVTGYAGVGEAVLVWDDQYAADESIGGYLVQRRTLGKDGRTWSPVKVLPDTLPSQRNNYTDTTLSAGTTYEFAIRALGFMGGKSDPSEAIRLTSVTPLPPVPAGLTATRTANGIRLQWSEVPDPSVLRTKVYRYQRGQKASVVASVELSKDQEFTDSKIRKGTLYFYYVTYENRYGAEGPQSEEVGIRP